MGFARRKSGSRILGIAGATADKGSALVWRRGHTAFRCTCADALNRPIFTRIWQVSQSIARSASRCRSINDTLIEISGSAEFSRLHG